MSLCEDIRQILITAGVGTAVESGGTIACHLMPPSPDYSITIYETAGRMPLDVHKNTSSGDYILNYGLQIMSRATQADIDQQETDMESIRLALHLKRNFTGASGQPYISIHILQSGYQNLGWEKEGTDRVRYVAMNFEVRRSK